jgi:hypothetical protein
MNLVDELHAIAAALAGAGIPYAICGGVAVTVHGATRSTKDLDVLLRPEDVARVIDLVRPLGYAFPALPMTFDAGTPRERHVQRISKVADGGHLVLDLLLADGAFAGALDDRLTIELPEGPLTVVSRATLVRMKRLAGRPQDLADLEKLESPDEP